MSNILLSPFRRFQRLLKVDNKDITQVYIYALFNGLVNLSLPLGIQAIINLIQGGEVTTSWIILVSFVIGGIALTGFLQLIQLRIVENIAQKIFSRASFEFAYRLPRIQHKAFYNYYAPELANRFFDTMTIQKGLPKILIDFSLALFQIVVGLFVLSLYHSFFIVFSLIMVALIYTILAVTGPKGLKTSLKESKHKYKIAYWLEEIARTKLSFKLVSQSDLALQNTNDRVHQYLDSREKHFKVLVRQFLYLIGFKVLIAAGLLITGSILVFRQEMNIGQFVAAEIIIILIIASVEKLIQSLDSIYDVLTALEKIGTVTDMPLDTEDGFLLKEDTSNFSTAVENLSFNYPDNKHKILKNIHFEIPPETSVCILGASGSGKSTLMQLLAGILQPTEGVIRFKGVPYKSLNAENLKSYIGCALNNNDIFQGTIIENIQMGRAEVSVEQVMKALELLNLTAFVSQLPLGLNTVLAPEGKKIPRSIQNKIILARAIVNQPKILMLEDPLDHVLQEEKEELIQMLTASDKPWSIIITTVDKLWTKYIDDQIIIDKGQVEYNSLEENKS